MMKRRQKTEDIVPDSGCAVKAVEAQRIKVVVHIPEQINEVSRRRKINKIYDILHPATTR